MGTAPLEWAMCELTGYDEDDKKRSIPTFKPYIGYSVVAPHSDKLSKKNPHIQVHSANDGLAVEYLQNCQLCGHPIKIPWRIRHDQKTWLMTVGSECVWNFLKIDAKSEFEKFKLQQILPEFWEWKISAAVQISTDTKFAKSKGKGLMVFKSRKQQLPKKLFDYRAELNNLIYDELSYAKLKRLIKRGIMIGVDVPHSLRMIVIPLNKTKSKTRLEDFM